MAIFVILGITASIYQLILLREFTFAIAKNELSLVLAVGIWIIFCSLGSLFGLRKRPLKIISLPFLYSFIFALSITLIHLVKKIVGLNYYQVASLGFIALSALAFFGALGFLVGYSFCLFSRSYLNQNPYTSFDFANFFGAEAFGFFLGGVVFTFFLADYRNPYFFSLLPLLFYFFIPARFKKKLILAFLIVVLSFFSLVGFKGIVKSEFGGAQIDFYQGTPYGPIIKASQHGVTSFYVNGSLVSSSEDAIWDEKFIHTTFSAVGKVDNVLFIGSSFSYQLQEILKYDPESLDYVSINETIVSLAKKRIKDKKKEKINFIVSDPRKYLKSNTKKYDCIIMNKPPPASLSLNRFYSLEFFQLVKEKLKDNGVFSFFIPSKRDILSSRILKFNSCILNTLDKVFRYKLLVPSDSMIVLTSQQPVLSQTVFDNFSKRNIDTEYLTIYHLRDYLAKNRRIYLSKKIDSNIGINKDYYPLGFLYYLLLQQAKFYPQVYFNLDQIRLYTLFIFIFFGLFLALFSLRNKKINYLVSTFVVGFSSIAVTAVIFIAFQLNCGSLFWMLGVLTGVFMLGLATGTFAVNFVLKKLALRKHYISLYFGLWVLYILCLWFSRRFYLQPKQAMFFLYLFSFLAGALTGAVYPLASAYLAKFYQSKKNIPVSLYAADLGGAFLGTLAVSVFLIPFFGVWVSLGLVGCFLALFCARNLY